MREVQNISTVDIYREMDTASAASNNSRRGVWYGLNHTLQSPCGISVRIYVSTRLEFTVGRAGPHFIFSILAQDSRLLIINLSLITKVIIPVEWITDEFGWLLMAVNDFFEGRV